MAAIGDKFLCPHCHKYSRDPCKRVCVYCISDYARLREVEKLVREATGKTTLPQELFLDLWIWRCKQRKDMDALGKAETLREAWKQREKT